MRGGRSREVSNEVRVRLARYYLVLYTALRAGEWRRLADAKKSSKNAQRAHSHEARLFEL